MKKLSLLIMLNITLTAAHAQIQRKTAARADSTSAGKNYMKADSGMSRKEILRELNLSREQKLKLRGLFKENKTAISEVQADATLDEAAKKEKLKPLRKAQMEHILSVLTPEQKEKLKAIRKQKKESEDMDMMMDDN
jgi:Spy/CpxP family protein refolding chaperone